ncbi:hypothetical protein [Burkholderia alba]|uniref:hypothetical protein n=1 Tax=Burkholderia alba TaxID=2683677 RepID=UPI002B053F0B|nr:hypothetical protein [Burkholderia alba]
MNHGRDDDEQSTKADGLDAQAGDRAQQPAQVETRRARTPAVEERNNCEYERINCE